MAWCGVCLLHGLSAAVPYYGGGVTTMVEAARLARERTLAF